MKISKWVKDNKTELWIAAFCVVVILLAIVFFQSLKKDHSLDMVKQELKHEEEKRVLIEQIRNVYEEVIDKKDEFIRSQKDSLLVNDLKSKNLNKQYNDKTKIINTYGSNELREYFRNLQPTDNDY